MIPIASTLFLMLFSISVTLATEVKVDETVEFQIPQAPLTPMQVHRLPKGSTNLQHRSFTARLRIPEQITRVPAAVMIHTCHDAVIYQPWIERLNDWGFATLSFSRCQPPSFLSDDSKPLSLDWKFGAPRKASISQINPDGYAAGEGTLGCNKDAKDQAVRIVKDFLQTIIHKTSAGLPRNSNG